MSADNAICVQKRGDKYWVWMGFASSDWDKPSKKDASYYSLDMALAYAAGWLQGEHVVEYGVQVLPERK